MRRTAIRTECRRIASTARGVQRDAALGDAGFELLDPERFDGAKRAGALGVAGGDALRGPCEHLAAEFVAVDPLQPDRGEPFAAALAPERKARLIAAAPIDEILSLAGRRPAA